MHIFNCIYTLIIIIVIDNIQSSNYTSKHTTKYYCSIFSSFGKSLYIPTYVERTTIIIFYEHVTQLEIKFCEYSNVLLIYHPTLHKFEIIHQILWLHQWIYIIYTQTHRVYLLHSLILQYNHFFSHSFESRQHRIWFHIDR